MKNYVLAFIVVLLLLTPVALARNTGMTINTGKSNAPINDEVITKIKQIGKRGTEKDLDVVKNGLLQRASTTPSENKFGNSEYWCRRLEALERKRERLNHVYRTQISNITQAGYRAKEELSEHLRKLEMEINRTRESCSGNSSGEEIKIATNLSEIKTYYQERAEAIIRQNMTSPDKIRQLKNLSRGTRRMTSEVIKSSSEIHANDIMPVISNITVGPSRIVADRIEVNTTKKSVKTRLHKRDIEITPEENRVLIKDGNITVNSYSNVSITNHTIKMDNEEIKVLPHRIMERTRVMEMELVKEKGKPAYKIKKQVQKKLFGFIPVNVESSEFYDGTTENVSKIKEEMPWWSALTTE